MAKNSLALAVITSWRNNTWYRYYTGAQPALNHVGARDVGPNDRTKWVQTVTVGASNRQTTSYSIKIWYSSFKCKLNHKALNNLTGKSRSQPAVRGLSSDIWQDFVDKPGARMILHYFWYYSYAEWTRTRNCDVTMFSPNNGSSAPGTETE